MVSFKPLVIFSILIASVTPWYTCDDREYCKNVRNKTPNPHFQLRWNSTEIDTYSVKAALLNQDTGHILTFAITGLLGGTFRIQIDDPTGHRHTMPSSLNGVPESSPIDVIEIASDSLVIIENGDVEAWITYDPFSISVQSGDVKIDINLDGRMEFIYEGYDETVAMGFKFNGASVAYGIPEHGEKLALKPTGVGGRNPYRLFNVDYGRYDLETPDGLYGSVPVLYAHSTTHTSGIFWLNSAETFVDIAYETNGVEAFFITETGAIDLFVLPGPTLSETVRQYSLLSGRAPLPPLFSLGYHQSRYSYETQEDLETVVGELDSNDFPVDVLWLDIDYTDGYRYFTWNYSAFPDPVGMQNKLKDSGRKLVVISDPHIKVDEDYWVYTEGRDKNYFVKNLDGSDFQGECWPGLSTYVDYNYPEIRDWYGTLYSYENFPDTTDIIHIWNDMNEPSVFNEDEQTLPGNTTHTGAGGWPHRDVHNAYGFLQTYATYNGMLARYENKIRPFILTRSNFVGTQRFAAIWTGDNIANWEHLRISIPMCLTSALAGISFCGADVGGFYDNPTDELYQRWYQLGAWLPFFRAHSAKETNRREPYLYPGDIQERVRTAIKTRYAHLPYWYTRFYEHETVGDAVIRPLSYNYPQHEDTHQIDNQFLIGDDIMIAPIMTEGATTSPLFWIPDGIWYHSSGIVEGPQFTDFPVDMDWTPQFYRGGSIIPRKDTSRISSVHMLEDPYTLYVYLDESGRYAVGRLYSDDNASFDYKELHFAYVEYTYLDGLLSARNLVEEADYSAPVIEDVVVSSTRSDCKKAELIIDGGLNRSLDVVCNKQEIRIRNVNVEMSKEFKIKLF